MMKHQVRGIVMEVEKRHCIIMTQAGEFRRVPRPSSRVEVGEEIVVQLHTWSGWLRPLALVASLLLVVMGWSLYQWLLPTAVAYVSLDINPSLELGVDQNSRVVEAKGLNADGKILLRAAPVKGKDIYEAVAELVEAAVQNNYLNPQQENLVFSAVEVEPEAPPTVVEEKQVYQAIANSVAKLKVPVAVQVTVAKPEARREAQKLGVSIGRYLLYSDAVKEETGQQIKNLTNKELKNLKLKDLRVEQWIEKHQPLPKKHADQPVEQLPGPGSQEYTEQGKDRGQPEKRDESKSEEHERLNGSDRTKKSDGNSHEKRRFRSGNEAK